MIYSAYSTTVAAIINCGAVTVYGVSGFGNGIIFHMGFQLCNRFLPAACDGSIATADTYIAVAGLVIFPLQVYILWKSIHWKLGIMLIIFQQAGLFAGTYIAYTTHSLWLPRVLGVLMCCLAYQRFVGMFHKSETGTHKHADDKVIDLTTTTDCCMILFVGITSGIFGGLFVTGGPPLMYFAHYINLDKDMCRATIALTYLVENLERVLILVMMRPPSALIDSGSMGVIMIVVCSSSVAALFFGNAISSYIDQLTFQWILLFMLIFGSLLLMTTGCSLSVTGIIITVTTSVYMASLVYFYREAICSISLEPRKYMVVEMQDTYGHSDGLTAITQDKTDENGAS